MTKQEINKFKEIAETLLDKLEGEMTKQPVIGKRYSATYDFVFCEIGLRQLV